MIAPTAFPLYVALAMIRSRRDRLLDMDLHQCIMAKSSITLKLDRTVSEAVSLFFATPASLHQDSIIGRDDCCSSRDYRRVPIISTDDVLNGLKANKVNFIDGRPSTEFSIVHLPDSINVNFHAQDQTAAVSHVLSIFSAKEGKHGINSMPSLVIIRSHETDELAFQVSTWRKPLNVITTFLTWPPFIVCRPPGMSFNSIRLCVRRFL